MSGLCKTLFSWRTFFIVLLGVALLFFLLYFDRHNRISHMIQSFGTLGIILAILFMMILCMTPIPSEGLLVMYMRVYGLGMGIIYSWIGSTLSMLVIYLIAKYFGRPMLQKVVSPNRFDQVNEWVRRHGTIGLLAARLLPIPAFVINYAAGLIPAVGFWNYAWTGALSILPYYLGAAFLYVGVSTNWKWILVSVIPLGLAGVASYIVRRRSRQFTKIKQENDD